MPAISTHQTDLRYVSSLPSPWSAPLPQSAHAHPATARGAHPSQRRSIYLTAAAAARSDAQNRATIIDAGLGLCQTLPSRRWARRWAS